MLDAPVPSTGNRSKRKRAERGNRYEYITSTLELMTRIWYGEADMTKAIESGRMKLVAAPVYCRHITRWLRISSFTTDNPSFAAS